jgi:hypothetical protein
LNQRRAIACRNDAAAGVDTEAAQGGPLTHGQNTVEFFEVGPVERAWPLTALLLQTHRG